jgi:hypothetical protein
VDCGGRVHCARAAPGSRRTGPAKQIESSVREMREVRWRGSRRAGARRALSCCYGGGSGRRPRVEVRAEGVDRLVKKGDEKIEQLVPRLRRRCHAAGSYRLPVGLVRSFRPCVPGPGFHAVIPR